MNCYDGVLVQQRPDTPIRFLVFVANAKEVNRWAHADDIRIDRGNVQRPLVESRWKQVRKFYGASNNNVIPTNVTLAFEEDLPRVSRDELREDTAAYSLDEVGSGIARISFPDSVVDSSFIIDGQHRLRGMRDLSFDAQIVVCLFLPLAKIERAFQFIAINNKSHKVPTDNLKALIANFDRIEDNLRERLARASVSAPRYASLVDMVNEDSESPFHKMVNWVNNRFPDANKLIPPTAIENSVRVISRSFDELKEDETEALSVFYAIWRTIFAEYGVNRQNAGEFPNLILKATIQAVTEMIVERIKAAEDVAFSTESVTQMDGEVGKRNAEALVSRLPVAFWKDPWSLKSLDTAAGRNIIRQDIRTAKKLVLSGRDDDPDWKMALNVYKQATTALGDDE